MNPADLTIGQQIFPNGSWQEQGGEVEKIDLLSDPELAFVRDTESGYGEWVRIDHSTLVPLI